MAGAASIDTNRAESLTLDLRRAPLAIRRHPFPFGTNRGPGGSITADNVSLLRDGRPWLPVMGEIHYARLPRNEWRTSLHKMRAGGIDVVASYVFWIHHEEAAGTLDWTGERDLRAFVETCREVDMPLVLRLGPWCHGEVRNGGFPDWLLHAGVELRSDDPAYLAIVDRWFHAIATQVAGLLWKDGGPIVGVQIENEFGGPGTHLLTLKRLAIAAGFDVPLYTRTGWPELTSPIAFGELLPLHGAYAEGFWDRTTAPMPGRYWEAFRFESGPTDVGIATDHFGDAAHRAETGYPFLTCECGGGMMSSYHRRIRVDPRDAAAVALVKLGSGSNLPGYYMLHGGTNPRGRLTTLQEKQRSTLTNWNDLPERNYDFQAPIGQYGQVRESYRRLRRLHLFCRDFGGALTDLPVALPPNRPTSAADVANVRWSVRSDGDRGFVFVNNYQRLQAVPARDAVRIELALRDETLVLPAVDVPADASAIWPFNLPLGDGVTLRFATAQPMCRLSDASSDLFVFAAVDGVGGDFAFDQDVADADGDLSREFTDVKPSRDVAFHARTASGRNVRVLVLSDPDSLNATTAGDVLVLTDADVYVDGDIVHLTSTLATLPSIELIQATGRRSTIEPRTTHSNAAIDVPYRLIRPAGNARRIELSATGVALMPEPADFDEAAVYHVTLPADLPADALLTLRYVGDVMRVYLGEEMIVDDFYNGDALQIGLSRHRDALAKARTLRVEILAMPADAPIGFSSPVAFERAAGVAPRLRSACIEASSRGWFLLAEVVLK